MRIVPTDIEGLCVVEATPHADERGSFARTYDEDAFAKAGLPTRWPQCNTSWNIKRGTLRGMHYQTMAAPEPKLVRCTRGKVFDVAVDIRPASATYKRWFGIELDADRRDALYIPAGLAHGFLALEDGCEVYYQMGATYDPAAAAGVRWNDPAFAIEWPFAPSVMSERDRTYGDFGG